MSRRYGAISTIARTVIPNEFRKHIRGEVRPERVDELVFRIGRLPEQEVGNACFTRGSNHKIRVRQKVGVQVLWQRFFIYGIRRQAAGCHIRSQAFCRAGHLISPTVVERNCQVGARALLCHLFGFVHQTAQFIVKLQAIPDEPHAHVFFYERLHFFHNIAAKQAHKTRHFALGSFPVFRGEGKDRHVLHAQIGARGHDLAHTPCTGMMAKAPRAPARDGAPAVLRDLRPEPPETLDVGEVEVVSGGTIVGVVELPPDIDPKGLRVRLGPWEDEITTVTDSDGRFRFENVAPGQHELGHAGIDGILDAGGGAVADVTSGETTSVVLDVTPYLRASVELDVVVGGRPGVGFGVEIRAVGAADSVDFMREAATRFELETTDEEGTARGTGRAFGPARVLLGVPGVGRFEHPTARVDVTHGAIVKETVHLYLATLELAGLDRLPMPTEGRLAVKLEDARGALSTARFSFRIEGGRPVVPDGGFVEASDGTFALEALVDGEVDATVHAVAKDAPRVRTDLGEGRWRSGPERAFERTVRVVLRAGERTRVDLD